MDNQFQIRPEDIAAYIVFQFKGLEKTLGSYEFTEIAHMINVLKHVFIQQATDRIKLKTGK